MKEATIYDIAGKLRLSPSTVSRALAGNGNISKKTATKVLAAAKSMGYRPSNFARSLRTEGSTTLIGVILHKLNSQFSINALYSMERCIRAAGYDIIITYSAESYEQEVANAENLFNRRVDGLIVGLAEDTRDMSHLTRFVDAGIPVVLFDRINNNFPGVKIVLDNFRAAYIATEHLINTGRRRIVHIAGKQTSSVYVDRLNGYKQTLKDNRIPFRKELVLLRGVDAEAAPLLANDILAMKPLPDAVFAVNDLCAALCMKLLQNAGITIPSDIAFVGFNNDVISTLVEPNLTTVNYSGTEIGELTGRAIIERIKEASRPGNVMMTLQAELLERSSSRLK